MGFGWTEPLNYFVFWGPFLIIPGPRPTAVHLVLFSVVVFTWNGISYSNRDICSPLPLFIAVSITEVQPPHPYHSGTLRQLAVLQSLTSLHFPPSLLGAYLSHSWQLPLNVSLLYSAGRFVKCLLKGCFSNQIDPARERIHHRFFYLLMDQQGIGARSSVFSLLPVSEFARLSW